MMASVSASSMLNWVACSALICIAVLPVYGEELEVPTCASYFYKDHDCDKCVEVNTYLERFEEELGPNFTVVRYLVGDEEDNYNATILEALFDNISYAKTRGVPAFFVGKSFVIETEDWSARLDAVIQDNIGAPCLNPNDLFPEFHVYFSLTLIVAFFTALLTVSIHPALLAIFARFLRALGYGELYHAANTNIDLEAVPVVEDEKLESEEGGEKQEKSDEAAGDGAETKEESHDKDDDMTTTIPPDTSSATISTSSTPNKTKNAGTKPFDGCSQPFSVAAFFLSYMLPTFFVGAILVSIFVALVGTQSMESMFVIDKIACVLFFVVCLLFMFDVIGLKKVKIHMTLPICYGSQIANLANNARNEKDALRVGLLTFVVVFPLTFASQLACYLLVAGRTGDFASGYWAILVSTLSQMIPCIVLYFVACVDPPMLDRFWRMLPKRSSVLSLIISLSAGLFAFCFTLEGLAFNPL